MAQRIVKEALIIGGCTLFLLLLCATVGITSSTPPSIPTAKAAEYGQEPTEDQEWFSDGILQSRFTGKLDEVTIHLSEHKLTDDELERYREGRLKAALAQ